jgi:hypothetical protein
MLARVLNTPEQRVTFALALALSADTDEDAQRAAELAERLAVGMTPEMVELCKHWATLEVYGEE